MRSFIKPNQLDWVSKIPAVEFADSTGFFKSVSASAGVREFADKARWNLHANQRRRPEEVFKPGDLAFLATDDLSLPKSRARKLQPRFIGPYRITEYSDRSHTCKLALPEELRKRRILFPHRDVNVFYDFGHNDELESVVRDIIAHRWEGQKAQKLKFYLRFEDGDCEWRDWSMCDDPKRPALEDDGAKRPVVRLPTLPR